MSLPEPPPGASKEAWREWARETRRRLDAVPLSRPIVDHLAAWLNGQADPHVLTYLAMPGEIDLGPLPDRVPGATFSVTRTPETGGLTVHPLGAPRERHPYGFPQPRAESSEIPPERIDVALVPGLVFDRGGVRIGHGRGYFDELLGRLRPDVRRVGITPSACVVGRLPAADHDVRMTHLATEHGIREAEPG